MKPAVKNLLIINLLFFLANVVFEQRGVELGQILGLHYIASPEFQPHQLLTHFFMHADFRHILFNMFALVFFGSMLERVWGAKRLLIFYGITAIGAAFLHQLVQGIELYQMTGSFFPETVGSFDVLPFAGFNYDGNFVHELSIYRQYATYSVGASGAVFGLLAAAALYFPNTEVMLYFAFRVKIKWLALGLGVYEVFNIVADNPLDNVAHYAHIGGALFGFMIVKIWQKNKTQFY